MSNTLDNGVEKQRDTLIGKLGRFAYVISKAGLTGLIPIFLYTAGPSPLGTIVVSQYINNYKKAVAGVVEKTGNSEQSYVCDNVLGILCNKRIIETSSNRVEIIRVGEQSNVNFKRAEKFNIDASNIPTEDEIKKFLDALSSFLKYNPNIESLVIKGQASPDGVSELSLSGKDSESFYRNQELAKKRAEYIKSKVEKIFPELSGTISIDSYVGILTEENIQRLKQISDKIGFSDGGLQEFIKTFNRGKLEGLSKDDLNFLNSLFDKSTVVSIKSVTKKITEEIGIEKTSGLDITIVILIILYSVGLIFTSKAYNKGLIKIENLIYNSQGSKREQYIDMYFGKEKANDFRRYVAKIAEIAGKVTDGLTIVLYLKSGVETYRVDKDKFSFYSKNYPFLISSFEGGIDLDKIKILEK